MKRYSITIILSLLTSVFAGQVQAQVFSTGTLANNGSNIEHLGTTIDAINFYAPSDSSVTPDPTLNGVTFTGETYNATSSAYTLSLTNGTDGIDTNRAGGVASTDPLYNLVNDGVYNFNGAPGGAPKTTLTVNGLMLGDTYALQLDFDSSDTRSVAATDGLSTSSDITTGPSNGAGFITDTFTATGTSETVSLDYASPALPDELSGFTLDLTATPEPPTYVMVLGAFAFLGALLRLRFKRA